MRKLGTAAAGFGAAVSVLAWLGVRRFFSAQLPFLVGTRHELATVYGSRVRYRRVAGIGPPIIFVHGYNLSIEDWEPVTDLLEGREVIALDLVGYAGSDRPADIEYDVACQHRYFIGFMDAVGIDQAVLVGHSIGGAVVGAVAARSPERVLGTVLIAPAGVPGCLTYRWPKSQLCRPGLVNRLGFRVSRRALFRRVFPNYLVRQHLGLTGSFDLDYVLKLDDIRSPMLLIWSSGDERCRPEYAEVYRTHVANVDVRILPGEVGHLVPVVEPVATASLIGGFVDRLG